MSAIRFLLLTFLLAWSGHAIAIEITANQPTHDRTTLEQKLQSQTSLPPANIEGFVHIPDQKERVLIEPEGREFRNFRTKYQPWIDAGLVIVAIGAMALLYVVAGTMNYRPDPRGRTIKRFSGVDRFIHWLTAVSFLWLALTGLNLVWGRAIIEPVLGDNTFASLTAFLKLSHNFVGFAFIFGLAVMVVKWLSDNIPRRVDLVWIRRAGGMFGGPHIPAEKFNFGQKMIYWLAVFIGGAICVSGVMLLTPFAIVGINGMQIAHGVHSVLAAVMLAAIIGHAYLGSIGVKGSFQAMRTGSVDLNWAKEHHPLWVESEAAKGHLPPGSLDDAPLAPAE